MKFIDQALGNPHKYSLQYRAFHLLLLYGIMIGTLGTFVNLFTGPTFYTILLPIIATIFCFLLLQYAKKGSKPYFAKIAFIVFVDFIYFPLAWLTTAGSLSSMPYYTILFLIVTFLLIEYDYEYLFPILFVLEAIFMMYAEVRWPGSMATYKTSNQRFVDIAIHFAIVASFLSTIFIVLFGKFLKVKDGPLNHPIRDELTGLYSRGYGMRQLKSHYQDGTYDNHTLVIFKLKDLKSLNQARGTLYVDNLIQDFAKILTSHSRRQDLCFRYSGNEFMLLLDHNHEEKLNEFIERIRFSYHQMDLPNHSIKPLLLVGRSRFDYNDINAVLNEARQNLDQEPLQT